MLMKGIKNIVINGTAGKPILLDLFFEDDGRKKPVAMYAHGFNGFKDWGNFDLIAARFAAAGFVLAKFNFSHNGTTPAEPEAFADLEAFGNNNYTKQLEDLLVVTNWIYDENNPYEASVDKSSIYLVGHSMGGGISFLFAAEDSRIKKLVTWAAISECKTPWGSWPAEMLEKWRQSGVQYYTNTRTNQQMPLYYQLYQDYQQHKERLDIQAAVGKLKIPVLICHGNSDIAVAVEKAHLLKEWQPAAELFIVESNHVFDRQHPWVMTYLPEAMEQVLVRTISFLK
jgi:dienelactone hydrolase